MSEAAKPADPERALSELEQAFASVERERESDSFTSRPGFWQAHAHLESALVEAAPWLLPLARAGLRADALERELEVRLLGEAEKYDALRAEFEAVTQALRGVLGAGIEMVGCAFHDSPKPGCGWCDRRAAAISALSGPLAAAVLRSPEPAAKEMP